MILFNIVNIDNNDEKLVCFLERKYNIVVTPPAVVSKWTSPLSFSFCNFSEKNMEEENGNLL